MGLPFVFLLIFSVLSPHAPHPLKRPCYPLLGLCLVNRTKGNFFYPFILQTPDFYVQMKWEFTSWGEWLWACNLFLFSNLLSLNIGLFSLYKSCMCFF